MHRRTLTIDASKEADRDRVYHMLGEGVLNDLSVRLMIDGEVEEDSAAEAFIKELKEVKNVHFYAAAGA